MRELWRWLVAAAAVAAAFFASLYLQLFLLFGPFPKDLAPLAAGFVPGLWIVLAGGLLAPRYRLATALLLSTAVTVLGTGRMKLPLSGVLAGVLLATLFVAWWFHPKRTQRSTRRVGLAVGLACLVGFGMIYSRYVDYPARPDALPQTAAYVLGPEASRIAAFYHYDLGGFLDQEFLWRIDANPDVLARVVGRFELRSTAAVPPKFWRMPPYYWPRSMPQDGAAFQSPRFSADRGPDGMHFFVLHDRKRSRLFVWVKDNF